MWKSDDAATTGYTYNRYTKDTIKNGVAVNFIQSDISINKNHETTDTDLEDKLNKIVSFITLNCKYNSGTIINPEINSLISKLITSNYVLEPPTVIKSMKINSVKMGTDDTRYMIWFLKDNPEGVLLNGKEYVLGPNEYVLYTNSLKTTLHAIGEGTKITRNTAAQSIKRKFNVTIEDIEAVGLSAISDDEWYRISIDDGIVFTEQEFVSLGSGSTVIISDVQLPEVPLTASFNGITFNDTSLPESKKVIDLSNATIYYQVDENSDTIQLAVRPQSIAWELSATLNLSVDNNGYQEFINGQKLFLDKDTGNSDDTYTIAPDESASVLVQFSSDIHYMQTNEELQNVSDHFESANINVYSYVVKDASNILDSSNYLVGLDDLSSFFKLELDVVDEQTKTLYEEVTSVGYNISDSGLLDETSGVFKTGTYELQINNKIVDSLLVSAEQDNITLNHGGIEWVFTVSTTPPSTVNLKVTNPGISYSLSSAALSYKSKSVATSFGNSQRACMLNFNLPEGIYILPINIVNTNLKSFNISLNSNITKEIDSSALTTTIDIAPDSLLDNLLGASDRNPHAYGRHWYIIESSSNVEDINLAISVSFDETDDNHWQELMLMQVLPLVKITDNILETSKESVTNLINTCELLASEYDKDIEFNYTCELSEESVIKDPLRSYSFFNPHHAMNKYTIAQAYFTHVNTQTSATVEQISVDNRIR